MTYYIKEQYRYCLPPT